MKKALLYSLSLALLLSLAACHKPQAEQQDTSQPDPAATSTPADISTPKPSQVQTQKPLAEEITVLPVEADAGSMTDVLGFDECHVEMEEIAPHQYMRHYYVKAGSEDICVAEQFGYDGPETWSRDLDGDGIPELICNCTYGDGVECVIVYRNHNGVVEEGYIRGSYYMEKFGWPNLWENGIADFPGERYDPDQGVFTATAYYTRECDNPVTVTFDDGLEPFDFYPFCHSD